MSVGLGGADSSALRFSRTRGRTGGSADYGLQYPSPFFDIGQTYLPATVKQMFRWCRYYFLVNPLINAVVSKMADYPITDIILDTEKQDLKESWNSFLNEQLRYRPFQIEIGLDYYTYGNALVSIFYPFVKMLRCTRCGFEKQASDAIYRFMNFEFHWQCEQCDHAGIAKVRDHYIKAPKGIRLLRWNPEDIDIRYNDISGEYEYYYSIPVQLKNDIIIGKKSAVESVPQLFIDALRLRKAVVFSRDNIYHFKRPTLAGKDRGWGTPMILPVLKDTFYLQVLRKAQECVSLTTQIETTKGLVDADEVHVGELVRTHTGKWQPVEKKWYRDAREEEVGKKISLSGLRPFPSTYSPHHPILSIRRTEENRREDSKDAQISSVILRNPHLYEEVLCPAEQLHVGEYVLYPRYLPMGETTVDVAKYTGLTCTGDWVYSGVGEETAQAFEALEHGEHVQHDNAGRVAKRALKEGRSPKRMEAIRPMTEDFAYILGWYAGDGSCGSRSVMFSLGKDDDPNPLRETIKREFGVETTVEVGESVDTVVLSDVIVRHLIKGLIPGTARHKKAPQEVLNGTDAVKLAYLRGLWAADGSDSGTQATLATGSRDQAYDVYRLLLHLGCIATVGQHETPDHTLDSGRVIKGGTHYHAQSSSASRDRFVSLLEGSQGQEVVSGKSGFFWKEYFASRIHMIEESEEDQYIDFKIKEDTTFCTPGTATKNSIAMEHIVPLRMLFPQAGSATSDPYTTVNLQDWHDQIAGELRRWRADNNYIPILPLPIGQETIGGDGRALLLSQEIRVWSEHIVAGMGVPNELIFGGLSYCQSPDTLLFTSHGLETLEELTPIEEGQGSSDRKVVSHLGIRDVVRTHNVGSKKAAWAKTRLGLELTGAHTHPVYVLQPDLTTAFKTMEELKPGDRVAVKAGANLWPKDVPKIDFQTTNTGNRFEDVTFPRELTPELARLLGYIVAEGSCTESRRIGFGNSDQEVNTDFADCVESVFGYRPKFWPNLSMATCTKPFYQTEISRQQATEFLYSLGIGGYAEEKTVPKIIRCAPKHLVAEFLKAYFEGDGGPEDVEDKQSVTACSKSGRLLQEIQLLMLNMGIVTSRYFPGARPLFVLQARSEHVDLFAKEIGFVSSYKKRILSQRTPTKGSSCLSAHIPYLKERLEEFRDRHFAGRSSWKFEPIEVELTQETYTVDDIAAIVDRDRSTIQLHIQSGALKATKQPPVQGRFGPYIIEKQDLEDFFKHHGLGRRRTTPKSFWGMNYEKLARKDLSFIQEKEPEFAKRITDLVESHLIWDEVQDIDLLDVEIPMRDLTVDEASTYQGNGIISHNSGSNVSLRMLENMFLGYLSDQLSLLRWVIDRTASYLSWPKVGARFKPFKMADDLQRKAYLFQLNQAGKMSDESLMADADYDSAKEDKIMEMEASRRVAAMKKQRLLQAEMEGEAALVTAKWQNKAQAKAMVEQAAIQTEAAKEQMSFQSEMQNGMMQDQAAAQTGQPAPQKSPDLTPTPRNPALISPPKEITSPLTMSSIQQHPASATNSDIAGGMNVDLLYVARQLADRISRLTPAEKPVTLRRLQERSPELHDTVVGLMMSGANGPTAASAASARALPKQSSPQRGPEAAMV